MLGRPVQIAFAWCNANSMPLFQQVTDTNRTRIVGEVTFARFGHALTALGDLDGDGYEGQLTTVLFAMGQ